MFYTGFNFSIKIFFNVLYTTGSSDIFALNTYTGRYNTDGIVSDTPLPSFAADRYTIRSQNDSWPSSGAHWLRYAPDAMRNLLKYSFLIIFSYEN